MNIFRIARPLALLALFASSTVAQAGLSLNTTRVIFSAPKKEAAVIVKNSSEQELMFQSWIDLKEEGTSDGQELPFALTPSLDRLKAGDQKVLRIFYHGQGADQTRESVYWLNVQEIPPASEEPDVLQIALRHQIKLFYRPEGLPGTVEQAPQNLLWKLKAEGLEVNNRSAFHVPLLSMMLKVSGSTYELEPYMVAPGEVVTLPIANWTGRPAAGAELSFEVINDYGGRKSFKAQVETK